MGVSCLGFAVLVWIPGVLHAQRTGQPCRAPTLNGGYFLPEEESYPHETKISYSCDDGLKPVVKGWWATSTCQNGKWSHEPQCIDENACIPPNIPNAKYTESSNGWYEEGHGMAVTCKDGYVNKNLAATACIGGEWFTVPVCEKSNTACSEPPNFPNAVIIHQDYQEVFDANSEIVYTCEDGYGTEEGTTMKSIFCTDGNWSEGPKCKLSSSSGSEDDGTTRLFTTTNYCSLNTADYDDLINRGLAYLTNGETKTLDCKDKWNFRNFALVVCSNGIPTISKCCNRVQINTGICWTLGLMTD